MANNDFESSDIIALNELATTGRFPILGTGFGSIGADAPPIENNLLQEDGFFLLQEDGFNILILS